MSESAGMRALLLAPRVEGVSWAEETIQVTRALHTVPLVGYVPSSRITEATHDEVFDVIHVAAHAGDEGVQMGDWTMTPAQLAGVARHVRAKLVFLNTCRSLYLPQYLIDQGVPAVIAHARLAVDHDALRLAAYFYEELVRQGSSFHRAYQMISPRDGSLIWASNGHYADPSLEPILLRLEEMERRSRRNGRLSLALMGLVGVDTAFVALLALRMLGVG